MASHWLLSNTSLFPRRQRSLGSLDCLRLEVESTARTVFGDPPEHSDLLGGPGLASCAAMLLPSGPGGRPSSPPLHLLLDQARWGEPAANILQRPSGTGDLTCSDSTLSEPCPVSGVICTGQLLLGFRCAGTKGTPAKAHRRNVGRGGPLEEASIGKTLGTGMKGAGGERGRDHGRELPASSSPPRPPPHIPPGIVFIPLVREE